jgi:hypothetical protein
VNRLLPVAVRKGQVEDNQGVEGQFHGERIAARRSRIPESGEALRQRFSKLPHLEKSRL